MTEGVVIGMSNYESTKFSEGTKYMKKYLIVGGVAGGATAAARLRRSDETARITQFERGEDISFANGGLAH